MQGTITFYNNQKGYGFLTNSDGQQFFFHITNFITSNGEAPVLEGRVRFDIGPAIAVGKKVQALNVQYLHSAGAVVMGGTAVLGGGSQ
jgi:cold shock CspA family protein